MGWQRRCLVALVGALVIVVGACGGGSSKGTSKLVGHHDGRLG